jgi:hypothetical protein
MVKMCLSLLQSKEKKNGNIYRQQNWNEIPHAIPKRGIAWVKYHFFFFTILGIKKFPNLGRSIGLLLKKIKVNEIISPS